MRPTILALALAAAPLAAAPTPAHAHGGVRLGVSVGLRLPVYPQLVQVPGYPVYYAPGVAANYFFHDGLYWLFEGDRWYSSGWYDGPWDEVGPDAVPAFVLRIPVGYYRAPPRWFVGWRHDAPPRWDDHWGRGWAHGHRGWDRWDRRADWRPAPLPAWQREYSGDRYPRAPERQRSLHEEHARRGWGGEVHDGRGGHRGGGHDDGWRGDDRGGRREDRREDRHDDRGGHGGGHGGRHGRR